MAKIKMQSNKILLPFFHVNIETERDTLTVLLLFKRCLSYVRKSQVSIFSPISEWNRVNCELLYSSFTHAFNRSACKVVPVLSKNNQFCVCMCLCVFHTITDCVYAIVFVYSVVWVFVRVAKYCAYEHMKSELQREKMKKRTK